MEEKRKGSPFSWAAVACGLLCLMVFACWGHYPSVVMLFLSGVVLGPGGIICGVVGYRRRERMRHWGWVGILAGLWLLGTVVLIVLLGVAGLFGLF